MSKKKSVATTKLGFKLWFSIITFGLIGQIAWIVENMYFAKFMQNNIEPEPYATTLMVAFSAIFATVATIIGGALCDRLGKRKVIICWGYILWGLSTMAFALIPIDFSPDKKMMLVILVVVMDCVMSYIGSTANDAAFNTWVTDVTDTTNRGKVDVVLAIMPVLSMVIVFVGLDSLTVDAANWGKFFVILGAVPIVGGILGLFTLKDSPNIEKNANPNYWENVFYSFRPSVIKENRMLYVALLGMMFGGASIQVYQAYLINFVEKTLGITDYVLPLGIIVLASAVISVLLGSAFDKYGKEKFYYPVIILDILGGLIGYSLRFVMGKNDKLIIPLLMVGGTAIMAASLAMSGLFLASFRDYIPKGKEGSFQGMRMFLFVLIPMILGPAVGQFIIEKVNMRSADGIILYPPELFLGAAIVVAFAFIPAYFVKKNDRKIRETLIAQRDAEE